VQSLRILAAGIAAVGYGQIFSIGVSDGIKEAFGFFLPGLPLFCSAGFSLMGLGVSQLGGEVGSAGSTTAAAAAISCSVHVVHVSTPCDVVHVSRRVMARVPGELASVLLGGTCRAVLLAF